MSGMKPGSAAANAAPVNAAQVKALRGFNRFYTQRIGALAPSLGSDLSLTEVRVLYELRIASIPPQPSWDVICCSMPAT